MSDSSITHHTFVIERVYAAAPARVFQALADPAVKRRWFGDGETHDVEEFTTDFRVGGVERFRYRMRAGTPFPGVTLESDGTHLDIEPGRRVIVASAMSLGGRKISAALATFEIAPSGDGSRLVFTHQAVFLPGADGPAMREGGWRRLLDKLADEVAS